MVGLSTTRCMFFVSILSSILLMVQQFRAILPIVDVPEVEDRPSLLDKPFPSKRTGERIAVMNKSFEVLIKEPPKVRNASDMENKKLARKTRKNVEKELEKQIKDRLFKSSSKIEDGLEQIVDDGGTMEPVEDAVERGRHERAREEPEHVDADSFHRR